MPLVRSPAATGAMKPGKHDRDLVGLERSLGFRSNRGISRQSNKDWLPIQAIVQGMKRIAKQYVELTTGEIRQSESLRQAVTDLFEEWAPTIWPDEDQPQPDWLEDPDPFKFEGRYPRRLHYNDEEDRENLRDLFYNLVVEKCCNYHSNQLQRARTSQRQSIDYLDSAGETPRKLEPGLAAESDSEMVDPDAAPPRPLNSSYHDSTYEAREAQFMKAGEFAFRVYQDYGMPSTEAGVSSTVKPTEPAAPPTTAISWTPANMAPKEHTQEPTPSETATSDRPDRPTRPKRKRQQPNEEELLPKKVSGDRKAKKPRWSQIIPLKVTPHHLERLANGERIAPSVPTSPQEETPPPQDDTIMSNADEDHGTSNGGSVLSDVPASPAEEFAPDNDNITVKRDPRSNSPPTKPAPEHVAEADSREAHELKSPVEKPTVDQPLSNGTSRPQSTRPGSESAPASRPATSHRENETTSKPPPVPLTAPRKEAPMPQELKWRPDFTPPSHSAQPPVNGLHSHHPAPAPAPAPSQNGAGAEREADTVGGAPKSPPPPSTSSNAPPRPEWHPIQHIPGQPPRREPQSLTGLSAQDAHPSHRSQISLVEEVLGPFIESPTAREMLRKTPNLSRPQLEEMRHILAQSGDAQTNFDVFTAHVYGRRDNASNGSGLATALASAIQPPAPPAAPPTMVPRFPPQHVLPSNGGAPPARLGAPPPKKVTRPEDIDKILGDLASCPTVKQVLQRKPDINRRELKIMRGILKDYPESRTNLQMLSDRLETIDKQSERSPSQDRREKPPIVEPPRGTALPSPRVTPGHGNPFNAFDSNQHARPPHHQQPQPQPPANASDPERASRLSIIRSPPISEGRRQDTPQHSIESNIARQPLPPPPGPGAFRPAAPHTPVEAPHPHPHPQPQPHTHQNPPPHPPSFVHAHGGFRGMAGVHGQGNAGLQHPPQQQPQPPPQPHHPQHNAMPHPMGPGRGVFGQQDVFTVRPNQTPNEKDQQRLNMPMRGPSIGSEQEAQTPQLPTPSMNMSSMSPTPAATGPQISMEDVSVEINWARDLDYSDYQTMETFIHCKTAGEFFGLIEAQMPDELQGLNGNGNRIKEIKVRSRRPLQGQGGMPRIRRDEASGRMALKNLVKKLRSQPPDVEIELEFLVVWE